MITHFVSGLISAAYATQWTEKTLEDGTVLPARTSIDAVVDGQYISGLEALPEDITEGVELVDQPVTVSVYKDAAGTPHLKHTFARDTKAPRTRAEIIAAARPPRAKKAVAAPAPTIS